MQIVKLALAIFLFQIIFFLCVSGFSDEISLSVIITNFWSKFVQGSISYHFENYSDTNFEVWIYFFFSVTRCLCNFFTAKKKTRRSVDGIQTLQFLLSSTLSCYLFFLDLWLTKSKGFNSCFVILPILSFISMEVDFNLLSRWIGFGVANLFQIFCALGCISMFFVNKGSYWLFVPYILIPGFDIIRTLFQSSRPKCDSSMYLEHLLPSFLLIAYIKPLGSAYMLFYPPETKVIDTCGVFLALGLLLVAFEALIKRKYSQDLKIERFLITSDFPKEDSCSICLESLTDIFYNQKENTIYTSNPIKSCWNRFVKLLKTRLPEKKHYISKTPCFHYFHEKCLQKWFNTRYECPYCRKELMQS